MKRKGHMNGFLSVKYTYKVKGPLISRKSQLSFLNYSRKLDEDKSISHGEMNIDED